MWLTAAGIDKNMIGNFRPNLFATNPKIGNAINEPIDFKLVSHVDSSMEIFPVGSGEWFEVSKRIAGDGQPMHKPKTVPNNSTIGIKKENNIADIFSTKIQPK